MKLKYAILFVFISIAMFAASKAVSIQSQNQQTIANVAKEKKDVEFLTNFFSMPAPHLTVMKAFADVGDSTCNVNGFSTCATLFTAYNHGALNYANNMACMLMKGFPSGAESALCHFARSMGMNPDRTSYPQTINKTFGAKTVVLTVDTPTETFATTAGYDSKGTVTVDGTTFMVLYWGGTGDNTKGFMIQGTNDLGSEGGGGSEKRAQYLQWNLIDDDAQSVKIWGARFVTSYLGDRTTDDAIEGEGTYNTSTKAFTVQASFLQNQRVTNSDFGCYRMYGSGIKTAAVSIAKTDDAHNAGGHLKTFAVKAGIAGVLQMDGVNLIDSVSTANGCQSPGTADCSSMTDFTGVIFSKSCNDIYTGSAANQPFENDDADFTKGPDDIF
jgi:hypothetical protein